MKKHLLFFLIFLSQETYSARIQTIDLGKDASNKSYLIEIENNFPILEITVKVTGGDQPVHTPYHQLAAAQICLEKSLVPIELSGDIKSSQGIFTTAKYTWKCKSNPSFEDWRHNLHLTCKDKIKLHGIDKLCESIEKKHGHDAVRCPANCNHKYMMD